MPRKYWSDQEYIDAPAREIAQGAFYFDWKSSFPNFRPDEIADNAGQVFVLVEAMRALQAMRTEFDLPFVINSAYRNPDHNRSVGGGRRSMHLFGHAFDVALYNGVSIGTNGFMAYSGKALEALALKHGFDAIGRYPADLTRGRYGFIHIDMRDRAARWGAKDWGER